MTEKRYDTNPEKELILEGLEFFQSSENPDLINPNEIKTLMDKLELKEKMSFIYGLISELCSNKEIRRNGGISKADFISFLEKKMSDSESTEGIHTLYDVFTDSKDETLPMTNFCRIAREIGDMEKDEELKQLLKDADMTGKELSFEEFNDIMRKDDEKDKLKKEEKKYQKQNINRFAKKNIWKKEEKEDSEPVEERYSQRSKKNDNITPNNNANEELEPKNYYSYRKVKVEQSKIVISPKIDEKKEEQPQEEKMITVEEIIHEKKVESPNNNVRYKYKYKNRFRKEPKEEDIKEKEKSEENTEENNINNNENSESKRYHRRYRPNYNNNNNESKNENNNGNVTYSRYRRKAEN